MDLPNDSVGISDIIDWQECARRMSFKLKRFTEGEPPEAAVNPTKLYGAAIHDLVEIVENDDTLDDDAAIQVLFKTHRWLTPEVVEELKADLQIYREREPTGVRTILSETELRVPLFVYKGRQIYFRGRIDRLYQDLDDPTTFRHRDYKSSRWPRTQSEVDSDKQLWAYNFLIYETYPEIETLLQTYDQFNFGELETEKTEDERVQIKDWLIKAITAILEDDEVGPDGLGVPAFNDWCAYCPLMMSCPVVPKLTDYALAEIAKIAPEVKKGAKTEVVLDPALFDVYVEQLPDVSTAKGVLERFESAVKARLMELPQHEREAYGYTLRKRSRDTLPTEGLRAAHRLLGDEFYRLATLSKTAVNKVADATVRDLILGMTDRRVGSVFVTRKSFKKRSSRR